MVAKSGVACDFRARKFTVPVSIFQNLATMELIDREVAKLTCGVQEKMNEVILGCLTEGDNSILGAFFCEPL